MVEFKGYQVSSSKTWDQFEVASFTPKKLEEHDIEIKISHCGVCGSDVHTLTEGWGKTQFPVIVGHEIAGTATAVGSKVKGIKVGDRVGVGAQVWSCMDCRACKSDNENYCPKMVDTYNAKYPDGSVATGGYSTGIRAHEQFVFPIPDGISNSDVCTMFCGGLTVYSPLKRHGAGPGKKVGVIGLGGLGHFAVMIAKAMGSEVTVFSHSDSKKEDALKMGAKDFVITNDKKFAEPHAQKFDLIISTRDVADDMPLEEYLSMLWIQGALIQVGLPDTPLPALKGSAFMPNGCVLGGSHIGCKTEMMELLALAAKNNLKPWTEVMPMKDVSKAVKNVKENKVRYRYVLSVDI